MLYILLGALMFAGTFQLLDAKTSVELFNDAHSDIEMNRFIVWLLRSQRPPLWKLLVYHAVLDTLLCIPAMVNYYGTLPSAMMLAVVGGVHLKQWYKNSEEL